MTRCPGCGDGRFSLMKAQGARMGGGCDVCGLWMLQMRQGTAYVCKTGSTTIKSTLCPPGCLFVPGKDGSRK